VQTRCSAIVNEFFRKRLLGYRRVRGTIAEIDRAFAEPEP